MHFILAHRWHCCDKELTPIGIRATVCHTYGERFIMPQGFIEFILEIASPDRVSSCPVSNRTSRLDHKPFDDPMEDQIIVIAIFAESLKIFTGFWSFFGEKFDKNVSHCCAYDYLV